MEEDEKDIIEYKGKGPIKVNVMNNIVPYMDGLVYLSSNMKDEKNVIEWIVYHLTIGFDKILIIDNDSVIPIKNTINQYNLTNKVDVIEYKEEGPIKFDVMNNIVKPYMISNNVKWFIHLDADEYINLNNNYTSIKDFLKEFDQKDTNIIAINCICFGCNNLEKSKEGLVIENYTRCGIGSPPLVKCFADPKELSCTINPHFWIMSKNNKGKTAKKTMWEPNPYNYDFSGLYEPIYINHYVFQSYEEYLRRKVYRYRDDTKETRQYIPKEELFKMYNEINNELLKNKYAHIVKQVIKILKKEPNDVSIQIINNLTCDQPQS